MTPPSPERGTRLGVAELGRARNGQVWRGQARRRVEVLYGAWNRSARQGTVPGGRAGFALLGYAWSRSARRGKVRNGVVGRRSAGPAKARRICIRGTVR